MYQEYAKKKNLAKRNILLIFITIINKKKSRFPLKYKHLDLNNLLEKNILPDVKTLSNSAVRTRASPLTEKKKILSIEKKTD